MRTRKIYLRVRMTDEESQRLAATAQRWGYRTATEFVRAGLGALSQLAEEIYSLEKRQAATMSAARTDIARVQRTEYVLFAMLENLAKTILTYVPAPVAENRAAPIALGKAAYERYLKAVGRSLHNDSRATVEHLMDWDSEGVSSAECIE